MSVPHIFFCLGLLLLPFSIGSVSSETNILAIGIPLLAVPGMVGFLRAVFTTQMSSRLPIWFWFFLLYSLLTMLFCMFSPNVGASLYRAVINLEMVGVVLYLFQEAERTSGDAIYRQCAQLLAMSGTVLALEYALHFFYQVVTISFGEVISDRVVGGLAALNWGASNTVAACLLITTLTTLGLILHGDYPRRMRQCLHAMFAVQVLAIGLTVSRTVLIILALTSMVSYLRSRGLGRLVLMLAALAVLVFLAVNFYTADSDGVQEVIRNRMETDSVTSMSGRTEIWIEYLTNVWQNYGLPAGYYSAIYRNDFSGHNNYLTLLYEMGYLGMLFATLLFSAIVRTATSKTNLHLVALIGVAINLMAEDLIYLQVYGVYFWLLLSLGYLRRRPVVQATPVPAFQ